MALINFRYFLILLSNMTSIDIEILLEHKNELLKYLSHLGDSSVFEKDKCFKALNNIEQDYFINFQARKLSLIEARDELLFF
ncbi:hypothetical protein ACXO9G_001294 [Campylobacter coli]|nr:hypothetical protein [Campylobacter coli]